MQQQIDKLTRQLKEAEAAQVHNYHFASASIDKASIDKLMASGVIIELVALGGREIVQPTLIRDGLSKETIEALKSDFLRSYNRAIEFKPKGAENVCKSEP